jgi:hypothetical protein
MAESRRLVRANGFSLVEMLVALVFTMVLMAGMASVFKASLSTFYTSGETLSSARRNRMSIELLGQDLDTACMYLTDLSVAPLFNPAHPPFYILPNMALVGAPASPLPDDPTSADEVFFYLDQPLPFEGTISGPSGSAVAARSAGEIVASATGDITSSDTAFNLQCGTSTYAKMVTKGQMFIFKDSWETGYVSTDPSIDASGTVVQVVLGTNPTNSSSAAITGSGPTGLPMKASHMTGKGVVIFQPAQVIHYSVQFLKLDPDPANVNGIPCLVRDQGTFDGAGNFITNQPQQIITEGVTGFKAYLSVDSGTNWAGLGKTYSNFDLGWTAGILNDLNTYLVNSVKNGFAVIAGNPNWFRSIPTLVRVDVTTRTATQRAEYSPAGNALRYKQLTQSLVFVPRHSGLPMD